MRPNSLSEFQISIVTASDFAVFAYGRANLLPNTGVLELMCSKWSFCVAIVLLLENIFFRVIK
jgi:hypothetical protein